MEGHDWRWFHYYWNFGKRVGSETYKTWRWELFTSIILVFFVAVLTGNWKDFRTAFLATGMVLGCFVVWHILRVPWLLHRSVQVAEKDQKPGTLAGMFGIAVIAAVLIGGLELGRVLWSARPLGTIEVVTKAPPAPSVVQTRVVTVQGPCKPVPAQASPSPSQAVSGTYIGNAPPREKTPFEKLVETDKNLTKGDRDRLADALFDFAGILSQGHALMAKASLEGVQLDNAWQGGTIASTVDVHTKALRGLDVSAKGFAKALLQVRDKWKYFSPQTNYVFGDNPDNEGSGTMVNAIEEYSSYLDGWQTIQNKNGRPVLNLFEPEQVRFDKAMRRFVQWEQGCERRVQDMRYSIK